MQRVVDGSECGDGADHSPNPDERPNPDDRPNPDPNPDPNPNPNDSPNPNSGSGSGSDPDDSAEHHISGSRESDFCGKRPRRGDVYAGRRDYDRGRDPE
jgi:hypothetical protein